MTNSGCSATNSFYSITSSAGAVEISTPGGAQEGAALKRSSGPRSAGRRSKFDGGWFFVSGAWRTADHKGRVDPLWPTLDIARAMRCTVLTLTPCRAAITRTPGRGGMEIRGPQEGGGRRWTARRRLAGHGANRRGVAGPAKRGLSRLVAVHPGTSARRSLALISGRAAHSA